MSAHRRHLYHNPDALSWTSIAEDLAQAEPANSFRLQIEGYQPSPLVPLHYVARESGVKSVYVKDETQRSRIPIASPRQNGNLGSSNEDHGRVGFGKCTTADYSTLVREIDTQLLEQPDFVLCPTTNRALAQAVIKSLKAPGRKPATFVAVEPDTAAPLWKTLTQTRKSSFGNEVNGEASCEVAWAPLKPAIDVCTTVSDYESHLAKLELQTAGIKTGLNGASGLAALHQLDIAQKTQLGLREGSVIVVICTEGSPDYATPKDVSSDDVITLAQTLVQIDSSNPDFGSTPGPGETEIARYVTEWLQHRDIESHWIEPTPGRPSVVGIVRGSGDSGGKSLMFNGHMDTVTLLGYNGDPLSGKIVDGNMYGRGTADMKSGLAASMLAVASAKSKNLRGDVILAAVSDEESQSVGTEQVLQAGWRADAAIVAEPTEMALINTHKGFVLLEVDIHGVACHGSRADLGVDAICKAGYFLVELDRHAQELQQRFGDEEPETGAPNIHAGVIKGGEEIASYPAICTIFIERRTIAGENAETVRLELLDILEKLAKTVPNFKFDLRATFSRAPYFIPRNDGFVQLVASHAAKATGTNPTIKGETYWTDMALLDEVGIPGLIWGPKGYGLHAKTEWVEVESVRQLADAFVGITEDFCK
ncbi:hypothetical protein ACHAPJ_010430 [Fusarium lateritium]